jgi:3-oxoacyl-[acyl-carrier-protein] synthase III
MSMAHSGNTVSSTIPMALKPAAAEKQLRQRSLVMLMDFGVCYPWGAVLLRWAGLHSAAVPTSSR